MLLLTAGCRDVGETPVTEQPAPVVAETPQYAGSASCAECHAVEYEKWKNSHHALAQRELSPELDDPAFTPAREITHGTQTSRAEKRDGRYVITTMGPDGRLHDFEPDGALGVDPLWQYLIPFEGGRWQMTELAFDPAEQEWFNVYGDEDRHYGEWGHWTGRGMNWNAMCAECHTTAFEKNYVPETDGYRSSWQELGVGCEQCHGPMKDHVDWQHANPGADDDPTITPLYVDQHFDTCGSCHARRGNLTGEFMPGERFLDHYEPVLPDLTDIFYPDGQVLEEDFEFIPFHLSYMHDIGIHCSNCHDSHSGQTYLPGNDLCLQCHSEPVGTKIAIDPVQHSFHDEGTPGFFCTDCHMPQTLYMQRHWRHDHGMTIPDPLLTRDHGIPNACNRCHNDEDADWALHHVEQWYGEYMDRPSRTRAVLLARLKEGDLSAASELLPRVRQERNETWRAVKARFLTAALDGPDEDLHQQVRDEMLRLMGDESPLVQAAAIEALAPLAPLVAGQIRPHLDHDVRLVRIKAAWALRHDLDLDTEAGRDLLAYLRINQDQPLGAFQWAHFHADRGHPGEALPWFRKAIRWDPAAAIFRHGYAVALSQLGQLDDAAVQLGVATSLDPADAYYAYSLGLVYAELNRMEEARRALQAAVAVDASRARYWYNLALACQHLDDMDAALDAIEQAEHLEPDVPDYPYLRATILLDLDRPDLARQALERTLRIDPRHAPARRLLEARSP